MAVVVSAVTAVAALFTAEAVTAAIVFEAIAGAGTIASVAGIVTGNEKLTKLGAEIGLVGGIGSFAVGALSSGAAGAGMAAGETGAMDMGIGEAAADAIPSAVNDAGLATANALTDAPMPVNNFAPDPTSYGEMEAGYNGMNSPSTTNMSADGIAPPAATTPASASPTTGAQAPTGANAPAGAQAPTSPGETFESGFTGSDVLTNPTPSKDIWDTIKQKFGDGWDKLGPQGKAEIVKSILAVPGGIQAQKNKAAELAIQQQNVDLVKDKTTQQSYGSSMPKLGILNVARG